MAETAAAPAREKRKPGEIRHPVTVSDETLAKVDAILSDYIEAHVNGGGMDNLRCVAKARAVRHQVRIRRLEARRKTDWGRGMGVKGV